MGRQDTLGEKGHFFLADREDVTHSAAGLLTAPSDQDWRQEYVK